MRTQTKLEEQLNAWSHGIGAALGIAALVLLIVFSDNKTKPWSLFSVLAFSTILRPWLCSGSWSGRWNLSLVLAPVLVLGCGPPKGLIRNSPVNSKT